MGADEKQAQEVRRLRRDLSDAQDKVHTLTSQLSTNVSIKIYSKKIIIINSLLFNCMDWWFSHV